VTKPFSETELVDTLREALAARPAVDLEVLLAIEAMQRQNCTEREIVAAVCSMTGQPLPPGPVAVALRRSWNRLRGR
jgi:hypothetical protein